jgi:hypothetical protein
VSKAAFSVFAFSLYLFALGSVLVLVPNLLLGLFRFPEIHDVWVRVVGMLVLIIGGYYATAARHELTSMLRATVVGRLAVLVFFIAFAALGFAPPVLILFGVIDAAAAFWTALALRADATQAGA